MLLQSLETGSPLRMNADGVVRVGTTRVTLDSVLAAFHAGASAEQIAEKYPSIILGDIYAVIAYYLWNRDRVNDYLAHRQREEEDVLREIAQRFPRAGVRERLLARTGEGFPEA